MDNQPFSVVENQGFVRTMNVAEPKYKLPTRKHLSKTVVPERYEKVKVKIEKILGPVHLLEKLNYVVRDNAHNMSAAMEKARFKDVSCLAHTLQLVIKDSVFNQKEVSNVITICRRPVGLLKHSVKANKQLKAAQENLHMPQKHMIQDEPTRWNSTLHMLERVLEQRRPLALVTPCLDRTNGIHLTPSQWSHIEAITEIFSLFENATLAISYQNVNVGETIQIIILQFN
ncbi:hypothetical protein PR048_030032 [Dryococelus australis]|uniref:Zinc finger BED domain-containing protein 4 n=1 Tax=Dryococelus australis TaxID=614101 RepID=A0ABQ9G7T5_9NEOP|nr:hypothetical protein PR048_030032 [Dryococelus australis]